MDILFGMILAVLWAFVIVSCIVSRLISKHHSRKLKKFMDKNPNAVIFWVD